MRPAAAVLVLGLALAVGVPASWALTRPSAAAGAPVAAALVPTTSAAPATPSQPAVPTRPAAPAPAPATAAPARIAIPSLGVDAPVDPVGVTDDGQMRLPDDIDRVGWYRFGPAPGTEGHAVLAGHVDDVEQGLGALGPLRTVETGAEVVVTDATGTATRWRVVSRELVGKPELPLDAIFAKEGPPLLVVVTCGGPFLAASGHYQDNLVVVAEPVR